MRKLKLQMQVSVDGYVAGPNGEMDWMVWNWDDELKKYVIEITSSVDCIILGRKLAQGFIPHWASVINDPNNPDFEFAKIMAETQKVVFTKTLDKSEWSYTDLAKGDLTEEINKLKNQNGKDIIVYGGGKFVSSLIKAGLIDEFHLFVNPAALGDGMTIFNELDKKQDLILKKSIGFSCGIVLLCYEKKPG
jgi:dihydrofolate reductase